MQVASAMHESDIGTLEKLNSGYVTSVQHSDVRWLENNLAEDFLNSNPDGSLVDRAGFLEQIARPATISNFEARDVRIRLMGDTAIIHGQTTYNKANGQAAAGRAPLQLRRDAGVVVQRARAVSDQYR